MHRRLFLLLTSLLLVLAGCGKTEAPAPAPASKTAKPLFVGMVFDIGGLGDKFDISLAKNLGDYL